MKSYLSAAFFLLFTLSSSAQIETVRKIESLLKPSSSIPADQVFLHIDRNLFQPGDTIRFQAYIRDRQTGIFETKSISLYVLLLNSGHKTIDSARFRIENSTASGWLKIPNDAAYNDYSVIAFTSRMMNYNTEYIFSAPFRVDKLRPEQPNSDQKQGNEKPSALQMEASEKSIDLRFLPEGGTFINGVSQRLAFNAVNSFGSGFKAEGSIINQKGDKICEFISDPLGPGIVTLTPGAGYNYYAILKGEEFKDLKWPLPIAENNGVSLSASSVHEGIITISISGKNVEDSSYFISIIMNNVVVMVQEFNPDPDFQMKVSTDELPAGTAFITLFNSEFKPVAERLIFVNSQKKLKIGISTSAPVYKRGELTELSITATDYDGNNTGAVVSVSVFDSISGFYEKFPFPDIESTLLYEKEIYDNLPVSIRLAGIGNLNDEEIDLLLMTYGWRKFKMKDPADTLVVRDFKNYDYLKIKNTGTSKKTREEISFVSLEGSESYSVLTNKNKEAFLNFDSLSAYVRQIMILPGKSDLRNVYPVNVEFLENKAFTDKAKLNNPGNFNMPLNIGYKRTSFNNFGLDSAVRIESVTIKGNQKPPVKYVNKYQEQYQFASTSTISKQEMTGCFNLEDILGRLHPFMIDTKAKMVYLRPGRSITGKSPAALFVVDDIPVYGQNFQKTYELIASMPADQISSVTAVKGVRGFTFYGEDALGGVIFVTTVAKNMMNGDLRDLEFEKGKIQNDFARPIRIFRSEIEYYVPEKEQVAVDPEFQFRPTLLWKSDILLDGTGPVKIQYPNNLVRGTIMIFVNGVSFTNNLGSKSYKYSIR
jgi:hypothetical protein